MELHALHLVLLVAHAHDDAVLGPRGYLEHRRQGLALDNERMVARGLERVREPRKDRLSVVVDDRGLAVQEVRRGGHVPAEGLSPGLMPETHAEDRGVARRG